MDRMVALVSCLLLVVGGVTAQTAPSVSSRPLPQWGTGLLAVAGFLFLSFVVLLVKKAWFEDPNRKRRNSVNSMRGNEFVMNNKTDHDDNRTKAEMNAYDNTMIDISEEKLTHM